MSHFCPECSLPVSDDCRVPYVCPCTKAVLTTARQWLAPGKKQQASDLRRGKDAKARDAQQRKEERGRQLWRAIHLHKDADREWYNKWRNYLIKGKCNCSEHFLEVEKSHPISFDSEQKFFESSIDMHNAVNERLERPACSMERAYMLWRHKRPATQSRRCVVSVAVGYEMIAIARLTWPIMRAYAESIGADFIGLDNQTEDWWGLEKFRAAHFSRQYDETLFLDADCVVGSGAPDVFAENQESICILEEFDNYKSADWLTKEREMVSKLSGVKIANDSMSLNSGVVLSRNSASEIWDRPTVDIGKTHCAEQIWVGKQVSDAIARGESFRSLDRRWNWQWWFKDFAEGLENAYIVHFASAPKRLEVITKYIATQQIDVENVNQGVKSCLSS